MTINKSVISISHNDLDGVCCQCLIRWELNDVHYQPTSYHRLDDTLGDLFDNLSYNQSLNTVIISDISLRYNQLLKIKEMTEQYPKVKFIVADHHVRDKKILEVYKTMPKNFIDLYSVKQCSSLILYQYFGINNIRLKELTYTVNAYDMWNTKEPEFEDSLVLNELYEATTHNTFFNGIGFHGSLKEELNRKKTKIETKIKKFKKTIDTNEYIYYNDTIVIAHIDKYKSILQYELNKPISIIISSNLNFSIRLSNDLTDANLRRYSNLFFDYFNKNNYDFYYAHKQVFGFNSNSINIMDDIEQFISLLDGEFN